MLKICRLAAGIFLACLMISCEFNFNEFKNKIPGANPDSTTSVDSPVPDSVSNKYYEVFKNLQPKNSDCGLMLGLKTITGYRTIFITFIDGVAKVNTDWPGIIYPHNDTLLFISKIRKDSVFGNMLSGWPPEKTIHYWEEIHINKNRKKNDSMYRKKEQHKKQGFFIATKENVLVFDSQFVDINYIVKNKIQLTFSSVDNKNGEIIYGKHSDIYKLDTTVKLISLQPDNLTFLNEWNKGRLQPAELTQLFSPHEIKSLQQKIKREFIRKSLNNEFADTIPPKELKGKLRADTSEIFYTLRREKGIIKIIAEAYALTASAKLSKTHKLRLEYDCGPILNPYIDYNDFPLDYKRLASIQKEKMLDALISPYQDILFLLNDKELFGIDVQNGKEIFSYKLPPGSTIIMAEWANPFYLNLWKKILSADAI